MIFYSHLTSKYYFFLFFFFSYFFFPLPISLIPFLKLNSHLSLIFIKLSPLLLIHHPLIAAIKAHHRNIVYSSSFSLSFFFFFPFLPPLLTYPTPLRHITDPRWPISPSLPTQAPSLKLTYADSSRPLFCLTHVTLSDPSWPLFSVWVTNFFKACLLIYRWVVSVFFIM